MNKFRRFIALVLMLAIILPLGCTASLAAGNLQNFVKQKTFSDQFSDIKPTDWYHPYVQKVFEYGLMIGSSDTTFNATGNITIASALAIADRIHSIYYSDSADFSAAENEAWYQPYVDYAVTNSIIASGSYADYNTNCTRSEFVAIMAASLPKEEFPEKNKISAIPDVTEGTPHYSDIYLFYSAGILAGSDSSGTFHPDSSISRSEVAAIVIRIIDSGERLTVSLNASSLDSSVGIAINDSVSVYLNIGDTYYLQYSLTPSNANVDIAWTSDDPDIVKVDKYGMITAVKDGITFINATLENGNTDYIAVYVESDITLANTGIAILKSLMPVPDSLVLKHVYVGNLEVNKKTRVAVYIEYSAKRNSVEYNANIIVWHRSVELFNDYYYSPNVEISKNILDETRELTISELTY